MITSKPFSMFLIKTDKIIQIKLIFVISKLLVLFQTVVL